jgi:hypothetical protein
MLKYLANNSFRLQHIYSYILNTSSSYLISQLEAPPLAILQPRIRTNFNWYLSQFYSNRWRNNGNTTTLSYGIKGLLCSLDLHQMQFSSNKVFSLRVDCLFLWPIQLERGGNRSVPSYHLKTEKIEYSYRREAKNLPAGTPYRSSRGTSLHRSIHNRDKNSIIKPKETLPIYFPNWNRSGKDLHLFLFFNFEWGSFGFAFNHKVDLYIREGTDLEDE